MPTRKPRGRQSIRCRRDGSPYNAIFKWQNNMLWIIWLLSHPPHACISPNTRALLAGRSAPSKCGHLKYQDGSRPGRGRSGGKGRWKPAANKTVRLWGPPKAIPAFFSEAGGSLKSHLPILCPGAQGGVIQELKGLCHMIQRGVLCERGARGVEHAIMRGKLQQTRECLETSVLCTCKGGASFMTVGTESLAKTTAWVLAASRYWREKRKKHCGFLLFDIFQGYCHNDLSQSRF